MRGHISMRARFAPELVGDVSVRGHGGDILRGAVDGALAHAVYQADHSDGSADGYRPLNSGGRRSAKAFMPSRKSGLRELSSIA